MGSITTSESSKKNGLVEILTRMGWTVTSMLSTLSVVVAVLAAAALCACMRACVRACVSFVCWLVLLLFCPCSFPQTAHSMVADGPGLSRALSILPLA